MDDQEEPIPPAFLRTLQIIAGTLAMGVVIFLGIVLYLVLVERQGQGIGAAGQSPIRTFVAVGFLVVMTLLSFVLSTLVTRNGVRLIARGQWWQPHPQVPAPPTDSGKLLRVKQTAQITGMALLEGASFFGCIAYLMEGQLLALAIVLVGLVLLLSRFPTEARVRNWLTEQTEQLLRLRQQT
jgi:hypothetical protein